MIVREPHDIFTFLLTLIVTYLLQCPGQIGHKRSRIRKLRIFHKFGNKFFWEVKQQTKVSFKVAQII
jgi:hypothetical protein